MYLLRKVAVGALLTGLILNGCAGPTPTNFTVQDIKPATHKIEAELRSVTAGPAHPGERLTDRVHTDLEYSWYGVWKDAVQDALNRKAIFEEDVPRAVSIAIKVTQLDLPDMGFEMTVTSSARYEIISVATGKIVSAIDITTDGTTPADYSIDGGRRILEALNRSVRKNISEFLRALEAKDINSAIISASDGRSSK